MSYRYLSQDQARVFRLLPVNPGPEVSTAAVAAMTELAEPAVGRYWTNWRALI
jgi:hypothetical protein